MPAQPPTTGPARALAAVATVKPTRRSSADTVVTRVDPLHGLVEVRRSKRRRRTVTAYRDGARTVVLLPDTMATAEQERWTVTMLQRLADRDRREQPSAADLMQRAAELAARYLGGVAMPVSVRWVSNQSARWGSCTPSDGTIRLSDRLRGAPAWVVDYVLLHELAHLVVPGHGPDFWSLVQNYPRTDRARGFLEGLSSAGRLGITAPDASFEPLIHGSDEDPGTLDDV